MKKYIITVALAGYIGTAGAATVKCIAFDSTKSCTYTNPNDYAGFSATCNGINIKGLGYCSTQSGSNFEISQNLNKNLGVYCWCKMISPAVSYWVFLESAMSGDQCLHTCSIDCALKMGNSITLRQQLFNNMDL